MYLGVGPRQQLSGWVRHVNLSKQGVGARVDRMAATNHPALKLFSGKRRQFECCLQAVGNLFAIGFRYRDKNPDRVDF